jgi:hypothetical protein
MKSFLVIAVVLLPFGQSGNSALTGIVEDARRGAVGRSHGRHHRFISSFIGHDR